MAHVQYSIKVSWDTSLIDVGYTDSDNTVVRSYVESAIKITTGAPTATASRFMPGATIKNAVDGTNYINSGSFVSPTWTLVDTGTAFSLPTTSTDATTTTGTSLSLLESTLTTGSGIKVLATTGVFTTGGVLFKADLSAAVAGSGFSAVTTGIYTGVGLLLVTANAATTGTLGAISGTGLTSGFGLTITTGTALTSGANLKLDMGAATAGNGLVVVSTGVYVTGSSGLVNITANSATTTSGLLQVFGLGITSGSLALFTGSGSNMLSTAQLIFINMGAAITGQGEQITSTGVYTGLNGIWQLTANSGTTGTIARINGTGLTSGNGLYVVGGGANMITGGNVGNFDMGAGIAGSAILAQTSGVYTGTDGVSRISATGTTTGILHRTVATAATLTTGRYYSAFDGALEVFGIGANGHMHTTQTTAPTIATNATGISAVAVTAGSTDVCGTITTTGTPASGTVLTLTFNKTYTTAPKFVTVEAANAAGGGVNTPPIVTQTATTFILTWPVGGVYAATPSFTYFVIA